MSKTPFLAVSMFYIVKTETFVPDVSLQSPFLNYFGGLIEKQWH